MLIFRSCIRWYSDICCVFSPACCFCFHHKLPNTLLCKFYPYWALICFTTLPTGKIFGASCASGSVPLMHKCVKSHTVMLHCKCTSFFAKKNIAPWGVPYTPCVKSRWDRSTVCRAITRLHTLDSALGTWHLEWALGTVITRLFTTKTEVSAN